MIDVFAHLSRYTCLNRTLFCFYSSLVHRCAYHLFVLMASFTCSLCFHRRDFRSFLELFRHVGIFHRNEPSFQVTCNLSPSCGITYKTYAAYKAHVYRHHYSSLQIVSADPTDSSSSEDDETFEPPTDNVDGHADDEEANEDAEFLAAFTFPTTTKMPEAPSPLPTSNVPIFTSWFNSEKNFYSRRKSSPQSRAMSSSC
jgi:hypothetical protein